MGADPGGEFGRGEHQVGGEKNREGAEGEESINRADRHPQQDGEPPEKEKQDQEELN